MLSNDILNALKGYAANMQNSVTFVLQTGQHSKRDELVEFLSGIASVSDNIKFEERDTNGQLRSAMSFMLETDEGPTGVYFSGIPSGHEFNSLILAMLWASGTDMKLDDSIKGMVSKVSEKLHFEVFVSLSCHNCPDVVQGLNQFALLNPNISSEMVDGGIYPDLIKERDIQGVPSVYLNGELFANGKVEIAELVNKLIERDASIADANGREALPLQDVTVVGGGPAGVAAAIYSARKGLKLHMADYDITIKEHLRVQRIDKGDIKTVVLSSGEEIETKTVIIATGARWRELGVPGEKENIGNGVAYCPHCDGPFFKGKDVAVIGGGNSGIEAALDLALVDVTQYGEITIDEKCQTSEPGIFACGDVTTVPYKQIVISMGEGSKAALSAFDYLLKN